MSDPLNQLPEAMWLGKIRGQWPVHAFTVEAHALAWMSDGKEPPGFRCLWRVEVANPVPLRLVPPTAAYLVEDTEDTDG
jgi:hypothetical protein